jgi:hypothetical protein
MKYQTKTFASGGVRSRQDLQRAHRRLDCLVKNADAALRAMRDRGLTLHLHLDAQHRPLWILSDGTKLAAETAVLLVKNVRVANVGRGLFTAATVKPIAMSKSERGDET